MTARAALSPAPSAAAGRATRLRFTRMHGAGNDFVVLDGVRQTVDLTPAQIRWLAHRHFGIGADQVLLVQPPDGPDVDFVYRIFNADGGEVEHCGNGARCFMVFVRDQGLTERDALRVRTARGIMQPQRTPDGRVRVDMGPPGLDEAQVPFESSGLQPRHEGAARLWLLDAPQPIPGGGPGRADVLVQAVSMGNPHAVQFLDAIDPGPGDPVTADGPWIECHARFPRRVNAGFARVLTRERIALRVYERGVGETLACGTGACAAVVSGIQRGLLAPVVDVLAPGGRLTIEWDSGGPLGAAAPVLMTGPVATLFSSEIDIPAEPGV